MEALAERLTNCLLRKNFITASQSKWCHYMIIHRAMNIISLIVLIPLGAFISDWATSLCLVLGYRFLRSRTGGFHAHTPHGCLLSAVAIQVISLLCLPVLSTAAFAIKIMLRVCSCVSIILLAPSNNAAVHLTAREIKALKVSIPVRIGILLAMTLLLFPINQLVSTSFLLSITVTAILLILSKAGFGAQ